MVSIPYSSGLSFRLYIFLVTDVPVKLSQSLIHQVSVSDDVKAQDIYFDWEGSQSLMHQVSVSDLRIARSSEKPTHRLNPLFIRSQFQIRLSVL